MIRVSHYIANYLAEVGIQQVFMLTGGGAMFLNDALAKHEKLKVIFNHHEQACAMAAESYTRLSNKIAIVNVTSGPGGLNALNGVFGAWTDSIAMLILSGQVRYDTTVRSSTLNLRQLGDQEYDIVKSVAPMTKYAAMVTNANDIKYHLQKALYLATKGRPGPVWLDIPMDVQSAYVDENNLMSYDFPAAEQQEPPTVSIQAVNDVLNKMRQAQRPVLLVGTGVRLSGAHAEFLKLMNLLNIPIVTAFNAHDVIADDHPAYVGRAGTVGDRSGNFAVQNADLLLVFGCRLNIRQVSYHWQYFARGAYKIAIDIDAAELNKPTVSIDYKIHADLADVIPALINAVQRCPLAKKTAWLNWCQQRKARYPVVLAEYWQTTGVINPYCFMDALSQQLPSGQITVTANATACITAFQTLKIKSGQRLYSNSGSASMGYDLPAAIGASAAAPGEKIICLAGDGSILQNSQELATIRYHQFPIKIFVLNNQGYHSIRQTQKNYFAQPYVGIDAQSGLFFPNFCHLAQAFEIRYLRCDNHQDLETVIAQTLADRQPALCEVILTAEQGFAPKLSSRQLTDGRLVSSPLEDLAPFLSREELRENMLIDLISEE